MPACYSETIHLGSSTAAQDAVALEYDCSLVATTGHIPTQYMGHDNL